MIVGSRSAVPDDIKADIAWVVRSIKFMDLTTIVGSLDALLTRTPREEYGWRRQLAASGRRSVHRGFGSQGLSSIMDRRNGMVWHGTPPCPHAIRAGSALIWTCFAHHLSRMAENASRVHKAEQAACLVGIVGEDFADKGQ